VITTSVIAPTLLPDALDSIKTAFSRAKERSLEEAAKDESLWAEVQKAFNYNPEVINLAMVVRDSQIQHYLIAAVTRCWISSAIAFCRSANFFRIFMKALKALCCLRKFAA
jgi:hypothetical protein